MAEIHPVLKKLQYKGQSVLVLHPPKSYEEIMASFPVEVHKEVTNEAYGFVQVFGTSNDELQMIARRGADSVEEKGLLWLCYPKKSSKVYKGSDCSRDTVARLLADEGYEPVSQIAIDEDWSALRFKKAEQIKTMTRSFAVTEKGKEIVEKGYANS